MAYAKIGAYSSVAPETQEKNLRRLTLRREAQDKFSSDKLFIWAFLICIISVLFEASLILVSWQDLPPQLPLFYLHPWGQTRLASPFELWLLPAITVCFIVINFLLALFIASSSKFLSRVLVFTCI